MSKTIDVTDDDLNVLLSAIGLALNVVADPDARQKLLALQTKLMNERSA